MDYVYAGEGCSVAVDFTRGHEFRVPDIGTVTYTIRDAAGVPLPDQTNVPIVTDESSDHVVVSVPASANIKTSEREPRFVHVTGTFGGKSQTFVTKYILIDFLNFYVEKSDVRSWLGLTPSELPDEDIDLVAAYYVVRDDLPNVNLPNVLAAGDSRAFAVNEAIRMQAALRVLPAIENRVMQMEKADQFTFRRMNDLDFDSLRRRTASTYADMIQAVLGGLRGSPTISTTTFPTDRVTGA